MFTSTYAFMVVWFVFFGGLLIANSSPRAKVNEIGGVVFFLVGWGMVCYSALVRVAIWLLGYSQGLV